MMSFIVEKRLQWTEMEPEDKTPFENTSTRSICYIAVFLIFSLLESGPLSHYNTDMKER